MPHVTFKGFYIGKFACSNYFNKVFIFFKVRPCILWDEPTTHVEIPMMPNNISEVKHTNKGHLTCGICCAWAWSSSHFNSTFYFTWSTAFFSFHVYLTCGLFKIQAFIEPWSCWLGPPWWIDGCFDFLACIRKECVCLKC